ncbi:MAG: bifunctional folylpolyglutamate synthase/dihydrofolate synthase [Nitrospirae bacterium]|nr:MAG: bifunctional folylpolyglutamate synthase/dihydrofolate synthase [Nitrospirota bacterium]
MPLTYSDTLDFLYNLERYGIRFGLDVIAALLAKLENPHHRYPTLHIGGTNGKGSCAAMAAAILQAAGYRVGLYTSPHMYDFRERIRVQGEAISEEHVIELTKRIRDVCQGLSPTFFEWTTAMALTAFADCQVDVAVIEVGMGGRLDATNVISPLATLITNIAFDHERFLGNTLSAIAYEKAGIVKPAVPTIVGAMPTEASEVIRRCAAERRSPWYQFGVDFHIQHQDQRRFAYQGLDRTYENLSCALEGRHQALNAACALALLEAGARQGLSITESAIRTGLSRVQWPGRLEVWRTAPLLLVDGAHNPDAAQTLVAYLTRVLVRRPCSRLILVVGMMRDKDHAGFLKLLTPLAHSLILTQAHLPRAATPQELANCLPEDRRHVELYPNPLEALLAAERRANPSDVICVTGSLILIGELGVALRRAAPTVAQS